MRYNHTQIGYLMIYIALAIIIIYTIILKQIGPNILVIVIITIIILILASVSTLRVTIDESHLRIKFGYGLIKKSFPLREITSAKFARNHWYYGWGIRYWMWPKMTIFNVSGLDAVEIKTKNNMIFRIGTDEAIKLERAIKEAIK